MRKNKLKMTLLGTGTSQGVPVISCTCPACTSTDIRDKRLRTSAMIHYGDINIGIDCGPDFRQQMLANKINNLEAILITHEHNDHIIGLDDVRPYNFMQRKDMPVYCLPRVKKELEKRFEYIFATQNKYPGAPMVQLIEVTADHSFEVEGLTIEPILVDHGRLPILGYRFGDITYLTDVKQLSSSSIEKVKGTRKLVLNALHKEPHYSHLNLEEALALIEILQPEETYLTHTSHRMGPYKEIMKELPEGVVMGYDGLVIE
jgi:phosphoribosyl 1,2-cyclic phosphate phosphodiesterase